MGEGIKQGWNGPGITPIEGSKEDRGCFFCRRKSSRGNTVHQVCSDFPQTSRGFYLLVIFFSKFIVPMKSDGLKIAAGEIVEEIRPTSVRSGFGGADLAWRKENGLNDFFQGPPILL